MISLLTYLYATMNTARFSSFSTDKEAIERLTEVEQNIQSIIWDPNFTASKLYHDNPEAWRITWQM